MTRIRSGNGRGDDEAVDTSGGGTRLTYRYRLGGPVEASGTIKAPSFLSAARRLLARRLADRTWVESAYLRLRAAGEDEVLIRITPTGGAPGEAPRLEVVPADTFRFGPSGTDGSGG